jgi:hypothetical protein
LTIADQIYEKVKRLPPEKQAEVLDFAQKMEVSPPPDAAGPRKSNCGSLRGMWKDQPPITEEDIAELRREMWGNFPKDFPE